MDSLGNDESVLRHVADELSIACAGASPRHNDSGFLCVLERSLGDIVVVGLTSYAHVITRYDPGIDVQYCNGNVEEMAFIDK